MAEASGDPDAEDELAELMDEYGRLQHRFEQLGGWSLEAEARRILAGLGFAQADMDRDIGEFSRRLDDARGARPAAARQPGPAAPRRADQPPRPGIGRVAAGLPGRVRRGGGAGQPRPRLHQRRRQPRGRAEPRRSSPSTSATSPTSSTSATSGSRSSRWPPRRRAARSPGSSATSSASATRRRRRGRSRAGSSRWRASSGSRCPPTGPRRSSSASPSRRAAAAW